MSDGIFILEDDDIIIRRYDQLFDNFYLHIFNNINSALDFVKSDVFDRIKVCVLDINLGYGFKISGFNVAFNILKRDKNMPIVVCTDFYDSPKVIQYCKFLGTKPIEKRSVGKVVKAVTNALAKYEKTHVKDKKIKEEIGIMENDIRYFMSNVIVIRYDLEVNFRIPEHLEYMISEFSETEEVISNNYLKVIELAKQKNMNFDRVYNNYEGEYPEIEILKNQLYRYIPAIVDYVKEIILINPDIPDEMINMFENIELVSSRILRSVNV